MRVQIVIHIHRHTHCWFMPNTSAAALIFFSTFSRVCMHHGKTRNTHAFASTSMCTIICTQKYVLHKSGSMHWLLKSLPNEPRSASFDYLPDSRSTRNFKSFREKKIWRFLGLCWYSMRQFLNAPNAAAQLISIQYFTSLSVPTRPLFQVPPRVSAAVDLFSKIKLS